MNRLAKYSKDNNSESLGRTWIASTLLVCLAGCHLPEICAPKNMNALPESFHVNNDPAQGLVSDQSSACVAWNQFFEDPVLVSLVTESLEGNQELKILAQDIRIANNEFLARRGMIFPFFGLGASAGIDKASRFTRAGAVEDQLTVAPGKGFPEPLPNFLVGADVSWEVDIWRKLRTARDAAALRYLGTQSGRNYVVTRMVSEVAQNYYELLALDNQLKVLEDTIKIQIESFETAKKFKDAARGTELAVQRFQAEFQKNQSEKLVIKQRIIETENRINYIAGRFPQPVERPSIEFMELQLATLEAGFPSQQLLNRSDIQQAEREVQASGLDVRVARARFYPSLILTAGVGYEAFNTKYLFSSPESLVYNTVGGLAVPLINRSAIKADYLNANAQQLKAIYDFQQKVINAHIEVVNFLSMSENYGSAIEIKRKQLESLKASVENASRLFQTARGDYIDVLLAQRDYNEAKLKLIEAKQLQVSAILKTYQALGGGWVLNGQQADEVILSEIVQPLPTKTLEDTQPQPTKTLEDVQ